MTLMTVVPEMLHALPELKPACDEAFDFYGDKPLDPYPVFFTVLRPATYAALDMGDETAVRRYFDFYERALAEDTGRDLHDLVGIELIEDLVENPGRLARAWPLMGERLRDQARVTARATTREAGREVWLPE